MPLDLMTDQSDEDLLAAYAAGNQAAAQALTLRHAGRVFAHAMRVLGDGSEAEDVTQEAMLKLWRIAPDWRPGEAQISTWLYRVTANMCIDRLRKRRTTNFDELPEVADGSPQVVDTMVDKERQDALQSALGQLPERQRQAVVLRHIDGLSNPEIGQIMDITPRAVESLTARGKRALTQLLSRKRKELGYDQVG